MRPRRVAVAAACAVWIISSMACQMPKTPPPATTDPVLPEPVLDEVSRLRLAEMCATAARQAWKDGGYEHQQQQGVHNQIWGYFSHYNHRLRRCLIQARLTTFTKSHIPQTQDFVSDAFEGIDVANASNIDGADPTVLGDDAQNGTSTHIPHTREWFKRLLVD